MYTLYYTTRDANSGVVSNTCFYDDSIPNPEYKVISPSLNKKVGCAGSLTLTLPPTNIGYSNINKESSEIFCLKNDKEIWRGRIYSDKEDFYNQKALTCEGELTYLNDTVMGYQNLSNKSYRQIIKYMLDFHNIKNGYDDNDKTRFFGPYDKRIFMGYWPFGTTDQNSYEFKGETVLEIVNKIAKDFNVYPKITWDDRGGGLGKVKYLDFERGFQSTKPNDLGTTTTAITDGTTTSPSVVINGSTVTAVANDLVTTEDSKKHIYDGHLWWAYIENRGRYFNQVIDQQIIFGTNLLDFTRSYDLSKIITAVTVRGSKKETADDSEAYYDLSGMGAWTQDGVQHPNEAPYAYNVDGVNNYGWREAMLEVETTEDNTNYIGVTMTNIRAYTHQTTLSIVGQTESVTAVRYDRAIYENVMYVLDLAQDNILTWTVYVAPAMNQMKTLAVNYLRVNQFDSLTMEMSAVDLNLLGVDTDDFDIYFDVEVISDPHNLDRYFPIMEMKIPLDEPEKSSYNIGITEDMSLTGAGQRANEEFYNMIKSLPTEETMLQAAKNNANQLIKGAISGYVTIVQGQDGHSDAIVISQNKDWTQSGSDHGEWYWNSGGLAYYPEGFYGQASPSTAITMDGQIVADMITTGKLMSSLVNGDYILLNPLSTTSHTEITSDAYEAYDENPSQYNKPLMLMSLLPHMYDGQDRNWTVLRSRVTCLECDDIMIGEVIETDGQRKRIRNGQTIQDNVKVLDHGDMTLKTLGGTASNGTITGSGGRSIPCYIVNLPNCTLKFCKGLLVRDEAPEQISGYYTGTITIDGDDWDVENGLIVGQHEEEEE